MASVELANLNLRFQSNPIPRINSSRFLKPLFFKNRGQEKGGKQVSCCLIDQRQEAAAASKFSEEEKSLIGTLIGIQGRGRSASPRQLQDVQRAVQVLEGLEGVSDPVSIYTIIYTLI